MENNREKIETILKACDEKKAYSFSVIDISNISTIADFFIICSVNNERQGEAVADEIIDKMSEIGVKLLHKEGYQTKRWILLDYGFAVVHIFHKDERYVYDLEKLWSEGKDIDVEDYGIENWN